ncbi:hypothetical protein ACOSP7_000892 [Xanthoceras sorbifolium]
MDTSGLHTLKLVYYARLKGLHDLGDSLKFILKFKAINWRCEVQSTTTEQSEYGFFYYAL